MEIVKLIPDCKDNVWGGEKLKIKYGKKTEKSPCAETWELSLHKDGLTLLENGQTLAEVATKEDLGNQVAKFLMFPLLIKFIDAKEDLSVQVHPDDEYGLKYENSLGKTEMWYVVEADEGAGLYLGFKDTYPPEQIQTAVENNTLMQLLRFYPVKEGDCFFIPAGTVHAIGGGCLICEIQQNSNTTYRLYDYGRGRQLHLKQAFDVSKFAPYTPYQFSSQVLAECAYFSVEKVCVDGKLSLSTDKNSFHCITCVVGEGTINGKTLALGDSYFVPANFGEYHLEGKMQIIKTLVP